MIRFSNPLAVTLFLTLALLVLTALYVTRLVELFPLEHDVTAADSFGDDWYAYNRYALSILDDGLTMPVVPQAYFRPAGFGYPYFIAGIYALAGVRSEVVYLVQAILLVAGIAGMYALFRAQASRIAALMFLVALAGVMYVDVYRAMTFRLLSENLALVVWPGLLFFTLKGAFTGQHRYFVAAGCLSGLGFLMRQNLILIGPAVAAVILLYPSARPIEWRTTAAAIVLTACVLVSMAMPLRNYLVTGQASVAAVTRTSDWAWVSGRVARTDLTASQRTAHVLRLAAARSAYVIGIPYFLQPTFRFRPHWLVIWSAFLWYLWTHARRTIAFWEALVLALAGAYFIPVFAFGYVSSYGVRSLAPGLPLVLLLGVRGLELSMSRPRRQNVV